VEKEGHSVFVSEKLSFVKMIFILLMALSGILCTDVKGTGKVNGFI